MEESEIEIVTSSSAPSPPPPPPPTLQTRHNEIEITKIAISPQSKYAVTYSEEDNSFDGWHIKDKTDKPLNWLLSFFGWRTPKQNKDKLDEKVQNEDNPCILNILDENHNRRIHDELLNFKVSDKKIIMYEDKNNKTRYNIKNCENKCLCM